MSFKIIGTGSCLPSYSVSNDDLAGIVDTSDEWISSRTGIKKRYILRDDTLLDISVKSAEAALLKAGVSAPGLDLIICATLQGDYITPSLSCLVQQKIGAGCAAFDINAACSGFIFALSMADAYFKAGRAEKILIVCAEQLSKFVDWDDRSTCVLFGDGAGAVVLSKGDRLLSIGIKSKGCGDNLFIQSRIPENPFSGPEKRNSEAFLRMNGQEIFKFAVQTITEGALSASEEAGISLDDIDYFLLHQANGRIIDAARSRLNQPEEKFPQNLQDTGNTSSASIPMLLDELNNKGKLKEGDILLLSAFGAGLTSGVCVLKW